ncbi:MULTISPECIES: type II toxin-antitoxin system RelE/ParE family toxin [Rhizobium]|uniref:type II toxin-antitoxin system RelE family toxin n=1 Tax=Rhizobium TaxID=379 RepID=UPI001959AE17|nr:MULTISPECIES: hypothetical protein [Rhizobium]MBM7049866.1 hypothetical protein [Rhizobium lusitanum]
MKHHAAPPFWQAYEKLPKHVRELADRNFELLKSNPKHPSLHFKQVGRFWSARVGISWRALAVADGDDLIWFWIGSHTEYDKLLR